jgi:hypothetical protein
LFQELITLAKTSCPNSHSRNIKKARRFIDFTPFYFIGSILARINRSKSNFCVTRAISVQAGLFLCAMLHLCKALKV